MKSEPATLQNIGARIKAARENQQLTQEALARRLGKTANAVLAYEKGNRAIPLIELPVLAEILGVSINYFYGIDFPELEDDELKDLLAEAQSLPSEYRRQATKHWRNDLRYWQEAWHIDQTKNNPTGHKRSQLNRLAE